MGYDKKTKIVKTDGSNQIQWRGDRNLQLYDKDLETHLRAATAEFYKKKSEIWMGTHSCHEYILKMS